MYTSHELHSTASPIICENVRHSAYLLVNPAVGQGVGKSGHLSHDTSQSSANRPIRYIAWVKGQYRIADKASALDAAKQAPD